MAQKRRRKARLPRSGRRPRTRPQRRPHRPRTRPRCRPHHRRRRRQRPRSEYPAVIQKNYSTSKLKLQQN